MDDLDVAIQLAKEEIKATPEDHPDRAALLNNLGVLLRYKFTRTRAIDDAGEAIDIAREAIDIAREAIDIAREAIKAAPEDYPGRAILLNNLGNWLEDRYSQTGAIGDLEEAIRVAREAINTTTKDYPYRPGLLNNLGILLGKRFIRTTVIEDIEEAIQLAQEAIKAIPDDHVDRATWLTNLSIFFANRYSQTESMDDFEEAIRVAREAVQAALNYYPNCAEEFKHLVVLLSCRFSQTGSLDDLEEAIRVAREAIKATKDDCPGQAGLSNNLGIGLEVNRHPDRAALFHNLGILLGHKFSQIGTMDNLEEAISVAREAIKITQDVYPGRAGLLSNLGILLGHRFSKTGALDDLEEAIRVAREAIKAAQNDRPGRAGLLNKFNLGIGLGVDRHPDQAALFSNLGILLGQKFSQIGTMDDLEEAISMAREAIKITQEVYPGRDGLLSNLGILLGHKFSQTKAINDLEEAISVAREALKAAQNDYPRQAGLLNDLANQLTGRYPDQAAVFQILGILLNCKYLYTGALDDLEEAIYMAREAIKATKDNRPGQAGLSNNLGIGLGVDKHPDRAALFSNLGILLGHKFSRIGTMDDLEEAINLAREAIKATKNNCPERTGLLNSLGFLLNSKYSRTRTLDDVKEAIDIAREAIKLTPEGSPNLAMQLHYLAVHLCEGFLQTGAMDNPEEAISIAREALKATQNNYPGQAGLLNNLANQLGDRYPDQASLFQNLGILLHGRYLRTGASNDLEEAIDVARVAIKATTEHHLDRAVLMNNLSNYLGDRYSRTGAMDDLDESIRLARESVYIDAKPHWDTGVQLSNLGNQLRYRHLRTGTMADLEEAICVAREAVMATAGDHPYRAGLLNNLCMLLSDRYSRTGALDDLEEAIRMQRQSVMATHEGHPSRALRLNNLGLRLRDRYSCIGGMDDLEEAICMTREAIKATPGDHPDHARWLVNLGGLLGDKYWRTRAMNDLEEAICVTKEPIGSVIEDHLDKITLLSNLGLRLRDRYSFTGAIDDLEEAICKTREAIKATPGDHPDYTRCLSNLGVLLGDKYWHTGALNDLEEAIRILRQVAMATPAEEHINRAARLCNLGLRLYDRYSRTGATSDLTEARRYFNIALNNQAFPISRRVAAGYQLLSSLDPLQYHEGLTVATKIITLVPLLAPHSLQNTDKHYLLSQVVGFASEAAAIALQAGKGPVPAIELLETGRGVLRSSVQALRTDLSILQKQYPKLAHSFIVLRDQLDPPSLQGDLVRIGSNRVNPRIEADQRHEAIKKLSLLLKKIRSLPGFERFLLSEWESQMQDEAVHGPIVILNVSSRRCDALLVEESAIRVLELPRLSRQDILIQAQDIQSPETLGWLWDNIVSPVLDSLGFDKPPSGDIWPHVWWIPTGPLVGFPLHAAGHLLDQTSNTALDRVVSSYNSSINSIIYNRQQLHQKPATELSKNAVLVAMKDTPEQKRLQYASNETRSVQAICESMGLLCVQPRLYKREVSLALESCTLFHFAGHGYASEENPLASLLLLEDWKQDPLTVGSLFGTNLSSKLPFLAYLSACGTGQIRHESSIDESIHLTCAFQLAGFRHVVGTLWEVDDELCVNMARLMYTFLRDGGISDRSVSIALHRASRQLRDNWVHQTGSGQRALRDIEKYESTKSNRPLWVPYVHYGV